MIKYTSIIIFLFVCTVQSQEKDSFGITFGLGKNFYRNNFETTLEHFNFKNPITYNFGIFGQRRLKKLNFISYNLSYIIKKVSVDYKLNEKQIPYNENGNISETYECFSLNVNYKKYFKIKKINSFFEIGVSTDYNTNISNGLSSDTNSTFEGTIIEPLYYEITTKENLGQKKITFGTNFSIGTKIGKKKLFELSANLNIPFNNIQQNISEINYIWKYKNENYRHSLKYKGSIIYPSIKIMYFVFKK